MPCCVNRSGAEVLRILPEQFDALQKKGAASGSPFFDTKPVGSEPVSY
tara:strand:+ start:1508 stop:1651 length:144 start_codon:yes stop_codon:yes gene_type:complete